MTVPSDITIVDNFCKSVCRLLKYYLLFLIKFGNVREAPYIGTDPRGLRSVTVPQ